MIALLLGRAVPVRAQDPAPDLRAVLERAARYVVDYEQAFGNLVAEETYTQWVGSPGPQKRRQRVTRAELVFVRLGGDVPWASFRDVFEVDGKRVRERDRRLEKLFASTEPGTVERTRRLLAESARYNFGPVRRTANLPTLPLMFLHPRNQSRFVFSVGSRQTIGNAECVELRYEETARPTYIRGEKTSDVPAQGRFWVHESRGALVSSEVRLSFQAGSTARFLTEYRAEPALAMWVPARMEEDYGGLPGRDSALQAEAVYSNFRRFSVTVEEEATVPGQDATAPRP